MQRQDAPKISSWCRRLVVLALLVAAVGCQSNAKAYRYVEAMNAERRALEDQLYALEYDLEVLDSELAAVEQENSRLKAELGQDNDSPTRRSAPTRRTGPVRKPADSHGELQPPTIDHGNMDEGESETSLDPPAVDTPSSQPPAELRQSDPKSPQTSKHSTHGPKVVPAGATLATNDRKVVRVAVDPAHTGGADFDGRPGDDGVTVVVQPKNASGQVVIDPSAISVAVLDPNRTADDARVARWDLDAKQVAELAEDPAGNRGFKLHFAWPDRPPTTSLLRLYVRYTLASGEHLDAEQEIHLDLPTDSRAGRPGWRAER